MRYYLSFIHLGKQIEQEVKPDTIRDAQVNETVILNTYFPDLFDYKVFTQIVRITNEINKRIYNLNIDYRQNIDKIKNE